MRVRGGCFQPSRGLNCWSRRSAAARSPSVLLPYRYVLKKFLNELNVDVHKNWVVANVSIRFQVGSQLAAIIESIIFTATRSIGRLIQTIRLNGRQKSKTWIPKLTVIISRSVTSSLPSKSVRSLSSEFVSPLELRLIGPQPFLYNRLAVSCSGMLEGCSPLSPGLALEIVYLRKGYRRFADM